MLIPRFPTYSGKLASGNVGWPHLASGAVRSGHVSNAAVVSGSVASGQLDWPHFRSGFAVSGVVLSGGLGSGQVGTGHIASGGVLSGNIASGQIGGFHLSSGSVTSGRIASGSVGPFHLSSGAVLSGTIASGQIGVFHLQSGLVTSGLYLSGSIGSGQIGNNHLSSGSVLSGRIASGQVGVFHFQSGLVTSGLYLSGSIGSGQIGSVHLASGSVISGDVASGQIGPYHLSSGVLSATTIATADVPTQENLLINAGFWFDHRGTTGLNQQADDAYTFDRWYLLTQTGNGLVSQTGSNNPYSARLAQPAVAAQRMGLAQIVEAALSTPRRSNTLSLQFKALASTTMNLRYAVLEWTGSADSVTSDVVNDWTSATYTAGNFFLAANLTVTAVGVTSVTTSQSSISINASISSSCNNLIVFFWSESTMAQNAYFEISQPGLYLGTQPRAWLPRNLSTEEQACHRYCFNLSAHPLGLAVATNNLYSYGSVIFPTNMRTTPTLQSGCFYVVNAGSAGSGAIQNAWAGGLSFYNSAANWTINALVSVTATIAAEL